MSDVCSSSRNSETLPDLEYSSSDGGDPHEDQCFSNRADMVQWMEPSWTQLSHNSALGSGSVEGVRRLKSPIQPHQRRSRLKHFHLPPGPDVWTRCGAVGPSLSAPVSRPGSRPAMVALVHQLHQPVRSSRHHTNSDDNFSLSASCLPLTSDLAICLSQYPAGRMPDPEQLAAIERDDFPAPPHVTARVRGRVGSTHCSDEESDSDAGYHDNGDAITRNKQMKAAELANLSTGMARLFLDQVESSEKKRRALTADPRSCSRSATARREPPLPLRFRNPVYASPSRFDRYNYCSLPDDVLSTGWFGCYGNSWLSPAHHRLMASSLQPCPKPGYGLAPSFYQCTYNTGVHTSPRKVVVKDFSKYATYCGELGCCRTEEGSQYTDSCIGSNSSLTSVSDSLLTCNGKVVDPTVGDPSAASSSLPADRSSLGVKRPGHHPVSVGPYSLPGQHPFIGVKRGVHHPVAVEPSSPPVDCPPPGDVGGNHRSHHPVSVGPSSLPVGHSSLGVKVCGHQPVSVGLAGLRHLPSSHPRSLFYRRSRHHSRFPVNVHSRYPLQRLRTDLPRPLPSDVDRLNLERHLQDGEFETALGMSRAEFYQLPEWRRNNLKRSANLF